MADWLNNLGTGLGNALIGVNNPFGLAPPEGFDRNAAMRQGALSLGMNVLANADQNPAVALGRGYRQAQVLASDNQQNALAAQAMMQAAADKKAAREEEAQRRQMMEQQISKLPPELQGLARIAPEKVFGNMIDSQFTDTQPKEAKRYNVGGTLVDENGNVIYQPNQTQNGQNMNPTELKAVFAAEDEMPQLEGTKEALQRALDLNDKTFTGFGAGAAAYTGANVPGGSILFDQQKAKNTLEWQKIMSLESIQAMSSSLKGATTDFELRKFEDILSNPETPPDIRKRTIERMMTLADRKQKMLEGRLKMLKGTGGSDTTADPLQAARDAIQKGADPEAVKQRLIDNGIDPTGLD